MITSNVVNLYKNLQGVWAETLPYVLRVRIARLGRINSVKPSIHSYRGLEETEPRSDERLRAFHIICLAFRLISYRLLCYPMFLSPTYGGNAQIDIWSFRLLLTYILALRVYSKDMLYRLLYSGGTP